MDINEFVKEIIESLSNIPYVKDIEIRTEIFVVKGRILFEKDFFLQIYYNSQTGTQCFALIKGNCRIWGIDYDNLRGWHEHPLNKPAEHKEINPLKVGEIFKILKQVLEKVLKKD